MGLRASGCSCERTVAGSARGLDSFPKPTAQQRSDLSQEGERGLRKKDASSMPPPSSLGALPGPAEPRSSWLQPRTPSLEPWTSPAVSSSPRYVSCTPPARLASARRWGPPPRRRPWRSAVGRASTLLGPPPPTPWSLKAVTLCLKTTTDNPPNQHFRAIQHFAREGARQGEGEH